MGERDMGVAPTTVELEARHGRADDRDAYERVLADVLAGNRAWFERMPAIEAQWRIVDALLRDRRPAEQYDPGTWGPSGAARLLGRMERWHNPAPVA